MSNNNKSRKNGKRGDPRRRINNNNNNNSNNAGNNNTIPTIDITTGRVMPPAIPAGLPDLVPIPPVTASDGNNTNSNSNIYSNGRNNGRNRRNSSNDGMSGSLRPGNGNIVIGFLAI